MLVGCLSACAHHVGAGARRRRSSRRWATRSSRRRRRCTNRARRRATRRARRRATPACSRWGASWPCTEQASALTAQHADRRPRLSGSKQMGSDRAVSRLPCVGRSRRGAGHADVIQGCPNGHAQLAGGPAAGWSPEQGLESVGIRARRAAAGSAGWAQERVVSCAAWPITLIVPRLTAWGMSSCVNTGEALAGRDRSSRAENAVTISVQTFCSVGPVFIAMHI